jgi:hypothetical protein
LRIDEPLRAFELDADARCEPALASPPSMSRDEVRCGARSRRMTLPTDVMTPRVSIEGRLGRNVDRCREHDTSRQ